MATGWSFPPGTVLASRVDGPFGSALNPVGPADAERWVWLAYDQQNSAFLDALDHGPKRGVVLIESTNKAQQQPFHKQKLGVLLSNQRHFALELQALGVPVLYLLTRQCYAEVLRLVGAFVGGLEGFEPAERSLRLEVEGLVSEGQLTLHPHPGWLTQKATRRTAGGGL